ncbi:hypothetical protein FRB90_003378 [Tulasnella sp. 427]|nr:hypothetical protein FRB90_003378 [Tulasnella sp. 427]
MESKLPAASLNTERRPDEIEHLNPFGLVIRQTETKGRGVFATQSIPSGTIVDISPVILFPKENYATYAKQTIVDDYAFVWGDGNMALALGLGSMMNHDENPNVSHSIVRETKCIKFITMKPVQTGDELCIYYGSKLWFPSDDGSTSKIRADASEDQSGESLLGILSPQDDPPSTVTATLEITEPSSNSSNLLSTQSSTRKSNKKSKEKISLKETRLTPTAESRLPTADLVPPESLPFERFKSPDEDIVESDDGPIPTNPVTQLALAPYSAASPPPELPSSLCDFSSNPFITEVPSTLAVNQIQLVRKNALWPVCYYPMLETKKEKEWTKQEVDWMRDGMRKTIEAAKKAKNEFGELPIAAHVTTAFSPDNPLAASQVWVDHDTRQSALHPLRHACMNVVRKIASSDSQAGEQSPTTGPTLSSTTNPHQQSYLLTGYTLFITHEPCIMCCMALVHSRVKDVVYFKPMPDTGGLGGRGNDGHAALVPHSVPGLKGVNHRFGIWRWIEDVDGASEIDIGEAADA